jgi:hypothetical protein
MQHRPAWGKDGVNTYIAQTLLHLPGVVSLSDDVRRLQKRKGPHDAALLCMAA